MVKESAGYGGEIRILDKKIPKKYHNVLASHYRVILMLHILQKRTWFGFWWFRVCFYEEERKSVTVGMQ